MTSSIHSENRRMARASVLLSGMPGGYPIPSLDSVEPPLSLRPGAAITFAIVAVVATLSFIEVLFS